MTQLPGILAVSCLLIPWALAKSRHRQVTTAVAAGAEDCFYIPNVKMGQTIDLEYQVTSSSAATGKNDITVRIFSPLPSLARIFESIMHNDGSFNEEAQENG